MTEASDLVAKLGEKAKLEAETAVGDGPLLHAFADIHRDHFDLLLKALEYEHGTTHWKEEPLSEGYVVNMSCEEAECHVCNLLATVADAAKEALA